MFSVQGGGDPEEVVEFEVCFEDKTSGIYRCGIEMNAVKGEV